MASFVIASDAAPATASRRAAPACRGGVAATATAPARAAAPEANMNGNRRRASCQTGTDVLLSSAAVYVESGRPSAAAAGLATFAGDPSRPSQLLAAATAVAVPLPVRIHEPTLIGEVT